MKSLIHIVLAVAQALSGGGTLSAGGNVRFGVGVAPPPPSFGNDVYCSAPGVCNFGGTDSFATLPLTGFYTNPSTWVSPGATTHVTTAGQMIAALAAATCGTQISVDASFSGQFTLPSLHCDINHWFIIEGFGIASLPAYGTIVSPCYANVASIPGYVNRDGSNVYPCAIPAADMPTLTDTVTGTGFSGALFNMPSGGGSYYIVEGLVITRSTGSGEASLLAMNPIGKYDHFIWYKNWFKGTTNDEINTAITLNRCDFCAVIDNFASEIHCISVIGACTDSKFVGGGTNSNAGDDDHAWKIVNNFAASSGQCMLFGGSSAVLTPTNIEQRNNRCFKPLTWDPANPAYNGGVGGNPYEVKNCFEYKNASIVINEGNKCENGWAGFTQKGNAYTLTPKNQSPNLCPVCFISDITIRWNVVEGYHQIFQIVNTANDSGNYGAGGQSYSLHDVLGVDMQDPNIDYQGQPSDSMMTLNNSPGAPANNIIRNVDVNHITNVIAANAISTNYSSFILGIDGAITPNNPGNIRWQNSIFARGHFGAFASSSGSPTSCAKGQSDASGEISACWTPNIVSGNMILNPVLGSGGSPTLPAGNCTTGGTFNSAFVNYNNGLYEGGDFHVQTGSPCHLQGNDGTDPGANIDTLAQYQAAVNTQ